MLTKTSLEGAHRERARAEGVLNSGHTHCRVPDAAVYLLSVLAQWGATLVKRKKERGRGSTGTGAIFTALSVVTMHAARRISPILWWPTLGLRNLCRLDGLQSRGVLAVASLPCRHTTHSVQPGARIYHGLGRRRAAELHRARRGAHPSKHLAQPPLHVL